MRLYSGPISLFTAKTRIALAEKGQPYERIEVGYSFEHAYQPHHPDVERLNPHGQVPVLVDGDTVVYDSTLIGEYLEERCPEPPLMPKDLAARARCRQLEAYADEVLFPHVWALIEEVVYATAAKPSNPERMAAARAGIEECHAFLDRELEGQEYLCGAFGLADIAAFVITNAAGQLGAPVDERFANLTAWMLRTGERPSVAKEVADMLAFFVAESGRRSQAAASA